MPDILDADGLQTKDLTEIVTDTEDALEVIYGPDINVEQNSPDGQQVNIYAQGSVDQREVLQKVYSSFDPDQAEGIVLDQRVALNGIKRIEGTFTLQDIEVVTDRALNLIGLDTEATEITPDVDGLYTIKDNEGTLFYLVATQVIASAGTYTYQFRAAELGKVEVLPNTINTPETILAGIVTVNNPGAVSVTGIDEETDFQLKVRRRSSTAFPSLGYLDSILSGLLNLDNVSTAFVYENDTSVNPDSRGIPSHSIWAIVEGGSDEEIADVIYKKKSAGCGMRGDEEVSVTRINGQSHLIKFGRPVDVDLHIRFDVSPALTAAEETALKDAIVAGLIWGIGATASTDSIIAFTKVYLGADYIVAAAKVSDDGVSWFDAILSPSLKSRFVNSTARITIL